MRTPADTAESREATDIDLATQETYRTYDSTLILFEDRPQTQRNKRDLRIKKVKKVNILQDKYDIY